MTYEKLIDKYSDNVDFLNITQNVSSFHLELLYLCKDINDDECSLREEDKSISKLQNYFCFQLWVPAFILDHSKPEPFEKGHTLWGNFFFNFNNPTSYLLPFLTE